jgi:hypothetical protein
MSKWMNTTIVSGAVLVVGFCESTVMAKDINEPNNLGQSSNFTTGFTLPTFRPIPVEKDPSIEIIWYLSLVCPEGSKISPINWSRLARISDSRTVRKPRSQDFR